MTEFTYFQIFDLLLSFCSVNGVRSVVCKLLVQSPIINDSVKYKQLVGNARVSEPYFAIVRWAAQSVQSHGDAPLLALDFLKEILEVISHKFLVT